MPTANKPETVVIPIVFHRDLVEMLDAKATEMHVSRSAMIRLILIEHMKGKTINIERKVVTPEQAQAWTSAGN